MTIPPVWGVVIYTNEIMRERTQCLEFCERWLNGGSVSYSEHFWYRLHGLFPHHPPVPQPLDTDWVSQSSVQSWCYSLKVSADSQVKSSAPGDCPHFWCQSQVPRCHLYFWLTSCKLEAPMPPSFRSDNLPEMLTDLRKEFSWLFLVYYKGYNTGTAKWERCIWQGM